MFLFFLGLPGLLTFAADTSGHLCRSTTTRRGAASDGGSTDWFTVDLGRCSCRRSTGRSGCDGTSNGVEEPAEEYGADEVLEQQERIVDVNDEVGKTTKDEEGYDAEVEVMMWHIDETGVVKYEQQ